MGANGLLTAKSPATVSTSQAPGAIAISPDGMYVYVTVEGQSGSHNGAILQFSVGPGGVLLPNTPASVPDDSVPYDIGGEP